MFFLTLKEENRFVQIRKKSYLKANIKLKVLKMTNSFFSSLYKGKKITRHVFITELKELNMTKKCFILIGLYKGIIIYST